MAHPEHIKAQALVELMTGESPYYVAKKMRLPLTTVKRWRNKDMKQWFREIFGGGRIKMAPKKEIVIYRQTRRQHLTDAKASKDLPA